MHPLNGVFTVAEAAFRDERRNLSGADGNPCALVLVASAAQSLKKKIAFAPNFADLVEGKLPRSPLLGISVNKEGPES